MDGSCIVSILEDTVDESLGDDLNIFILLLLNILVKTSEFLFNP